MKKFDVIVVTTTAQLPVLPHVIGAPLVFPSAPFGTVSVAEPRPLVGVTSLLLGPPSGAQSPGPVSGRPSFAHTATLSVVSVRGNPLYATVTSLPFWIGPVGVRAIAG